MSEAAEWFADGDLWGLEDTVGGFCCDADVHVTSEEKDDGYLFGITKQLQEPEHV